MLLPQDVLSLPEIEREKGMRLKLPLLSALLRHLVSVGGAGAPVETVAGDFFSEPEFVLQALRVSERLIPDAETSAVTEEEVFESVHLLAQAIDEICGLPQLPRELVENVYTGPKKKKEEVHRQQLDARRQMVAEELRAREEKLRRWREAQQATKAPLPNPVASVSASPQFIRETGAAQSQAVRPRRRIPVAFITCCLGLIVMVGTGFTFRNDLWQQIHPIMYGTKEQVMPVRAQAEKVWQRMLALDDRQGMDTLRAEAGNLKRDAELLLAQKKYSEAENAFRRFITFCDELEIRDQDRTAARQKQTDVQKLRKTAQAERLPQLTPELWQEAETMNVAAERAFNSGNFQEATQRWEDAGRIYENARTMARQRRVETVSEPSDVMIRQPVEENLSAEDQ